MSTPAVTLTSVEPPEVRSASMTGIRERGARSQPALPVFSCSLIQKID